MKRPRTRLLSAALLVAGLFALGAAAAESAGDEGENNKRLLQRYRQAEPEHYARLRRDYLIFAALPPARRDGLRRLDDVLHDEDPSSQRLWIVLDRYAAWLERLPEEDRARVRAAADGPARLAVVRELREREWVARLPRATREGVLATPEGPERDRLVAALRKKERDRRAELTRALKPPEGGRPGQGRLPMPYPRLAAFFKELTEEDKRRLQVSGLEDEASRERVAQEFAKRNPKQAEKYRENREKKKKAEAK